VLAFGEIGGSASRTRDVAIREYAPGAELVIDGLVYRSEGVRPAWGGGADASHLEDLREHWSCCACGAFGWNGFCRKHVQTAGQQGSSTGEHWSRSGS
jgi:hypothetical protein